MRQQDKFVSIISHDLRNPVGSIKSLATLMSEELSAGDMDSIGEYVQLITSQADNTFNLLINLLDWSKSQVFFKSSSSKRPSCQTLSVKR